VLASSPGGASGSLGIRKTSLHQSRKRLYISRRRRAALFEQLAGAAQFVANVEKQRNHFISAFR
jgi:hypothetical protein